MHTFSSRMRPVHGWPKHACVIHLAHFMKCATTDYHPTIWRTCRVLANLNRLACLKFIFENPAASVSETAQGLHVPVNQASIFLRALQSRGLIQAGRQGRSVQYFARPDPLVPSAAPILQAVREELIQCKRPGEDIKRIMTAFTHPRRIIILARLQQYGGDTEETLAAGTEISLRALKRHLKKLQSRSLVVLDADIWKVTLSATGLAQVLLALCRPEPK